MRKIRLFCAAGMSTSLLVKKMQDYAASINYECDICAYSVSEVADKGADADICLLGPQVRFELNNVKAKLPEGKIVMPIDMMAYGMMDGKAVIESVKKELGD
ncbi:MAG: PTS sugar transporter subunit IIB [Erysipelotrichaceae bacterium]